MAILSLSANKSVASGNETVKFTVSYEPNQKVDLLESVTGIDSVVGSGTTDNTGTAVIEWRGATKGVHTFYAVHSILPGISPCGFYCDESNEISVSIEDAPCDPWDIGCRISPSIDTKLIAAAVIIIVIFIFIFMYGPKRR